MKVFRESAIRKGADQPTLKMLDLWHELVSKKIGAPIEVGVACRKDFPQFKNFRGEINTAMPMKVQNKPFLVLIFEDTSNVEEVILTHELGHCVLKLQGFSPFICIPERHSNNEIMLNSLAHHPPLYALQRSLGHEPQKEVDKRARHDLKLFSKGAEKPGKQLWVQNALLAADDLLHCSQEFREKMLATLQARYPRTTKLVNKILEASSHYDLLDQTGNEKFIRQVIQKLQLGSAWISAPELDLEALHTIVEETSDTSTPS